MARKLVIFLKYDGWNDGEARIYECDKDEDAEYFYRRRIEKESWYADKAFIVDSESELPVEKWLKKKEREDDKYWAEEEERKDREEYNRLKRKYGDKEND